MDALTAGTGPTTGSPSLLGREIRPAPASGIAGTSHEIATDVVLGPAFDGGYYLIGLRVPRPDLFRGIPWSTPAVLEETLAVVDRLGLCCHLLPPGFDVLRHSSPDGLLRVLRKVATQLFEHLRRARPGLLFDQQCRGVKAGGRADPAGRLVQLRRRERADKKRITLRLES